MSMMMMVMVLVLCCEDADVDYDNCNVDVGVGGDDYDDEHHGDAGCVCGMKYAFVNIMIQYYVHVVFKKRMLTFFPKLDKVLIIRLTTF